MARYTELSANDVREILKQYQLSLEYFTPIEGGAANSSYRLQTTQGSYVLTVFDDSSWQDVLNLGQLLQLLAKRNFPTTAILCTVEGETAVSHHNNPVIIKPFITGHVATDIPNKALFQIGSALAKLHQIPAPAYLSQHHQYGIEQFQIAFNSNIDTPYENWLANKTKFLKSHLLQTLPKGLIHGDLFYDNVLVEAGQFKAILDFEAACHYEFAFDIGMTIVGLCHEEDFIHLDKARVFIEGYQSNRQLEPVEKTAVQLFTQYAAIATSYWRFWKYNIDTPTSDKATKHWQMANIANFIAAIPLSEFLDTIF